MFLSRFGGGLDIGFGGVGNVLTFKGTPGNIYDLPPGQVLTLSPAGAYMVRCGLYTSIQQLDPTSGIWRTIGGGVNGGRMAGPQVALSQATLNQGRDLPVLTDYRALVGGLAARQFGLSQQRLGGVCPGVTPTDLALA